MTARLYTKEDHAPFIGTRHGDWTVIGIVESAKKPRLRWLCRCKCGHERVVSPPSIRFGGSSCCKKGVCSPKYKHGHAMRSGCGTEYMIWRGMNARCRDPKTKGFLRYGGRGIAVCERWRNNFENFLADMGPKPSPAHSIDRRDNDGNYEPGNCYWATQREQMRNMRRNHLLTFSGETLPVVSWAERCGVSVSTINGRLRLGWSVEKIFTIPFRTCRNGTRP